MKRIICASPTYLKEFGTPKNLEDLRSHNCLGSDSSSSNIWTFQENGKDKEVLVSGNVHSKNSFDLRTLATNDVGIAYLSHYLVNAEIKSGNLISILEPYQKYQDIYAVYPSDKFLNKKTQTFLNFITELMAPLFV
jgi:DNA-binding transcriptional LysR family regulator